MATTTRPSNKTLLARLAIEPKKVETAILTLPTNSEISEIAPIAVPDSAPTVAASPVDYVKFYGAQEMIVAMSPAPSEAVSVPELVWTTYKADGQSVKHYATGRLGTLYCIDRLPEFKEYGLTVNGARQYQKDVRPLTARHWFVLKAAKTSAYVIEKGRIAK